VEWRLKYYHREAAALKLYFPSAEIVEADGKGKPAPRRIPQIAHPAAKDVSFGTLRTGQI